MIQEIIDHQHDDIAIPECLLDDDRYKFVIPIELFYDNVRKKWPDGNNERQAAFKRNAERNKQAASGSSSTDPLPSEDESGTD